MMFKDVISHKCRLDQLFLSRAKNNIRENVKNREKA